MCTPFFGSVVTGSAFLAGPDALLLPDVRACNPGKKHFVFSVLRFTSADQRNSMVKRLLKNHNESRRPELIRLFLSSIRDFPSHFGLGNRGHPKDTDQRHIFLDSSTDLSNPSNRFFGVLP